MKSTSSNVRIKLGVTISYLVMIAANSLVNILRLNDMNTGEVSARYDTLFTPAAFAFAIWGPIYLMLAVYVLFRLLPGKGEDEARMRKVDIWFIISCLINAIWIFAWQYELMTLTVVLMLLLLGCLIRIGLLISTPRHQVREELTLRVPFGLYFGWITVATIANVSVWLVSLGWDGFGISDTVWTTVVLAVGLAIAGVTMYRIRNLAYGLAVTWAYTWILVRQVSPTGYAGQYPLIIVTALISLGALLAVLAATAIRMREAAGGAAKD